MKRTLIRFDSDPTLRALFVALCVAVAAACGEAEESPGSAGAEAETAGGPSAAAAASDTTRRFVITELGHTVGDPGAPIRVVEFSDFACPHCREFHLTSYPTVHEEFVETGTVQWKYIPYVLGAFPNSVAAARAGECAIEQDAFPPMRDRLFEEQATWVNSEEPIDLFLEYAREEGLDPERLETCIEEGHREDRVQRNIEVGQQIGIRGTPTFIVNGEHVQGNRPPEFFRRVFELIQNPELLDSLRADSLPSGTGDA